MTRGRGHIRLKQRRRCQPEGQRHDPEHHENDAAERRRLILVPGHEPIVQPTCDALRRRGADVLSDLPPPVAHAQGTCPDDRHTSPRRLTAGGILLLIASALLVGVALIGPYVAALLAAASIITTTILRRRLGAWWPAILVVGILALLAGLGMAVLSIDVSAGR